MGKRQADLQPGADFAGYPDLGLFCRGKLNIAEIGNQIADFQYEKGLFVPKLYFPYW